MQREGVDEEALYIGSHYELVQQGGWSEPIAVFGETGNAQDSPSMVHDADGTIYLVWVEYLDSGFQQVRFARWVAGAGWSVSELVKDDIQQHVDTGIQPVVTINPTTKEVYVAWQEYNSTANTNEIHVSRQGTGWSDTVEASVDIQSGAPQPAMIVTSGGDVYLAWTGWRNDLDQTVVYVKQPGSGQPWEYQTDPTNGLDQGEAALVSDSAGAVYLAYSEANDIYVVRRTGSGWASSAELVSDLDHTGGTPTLAVDSEDNLFVLWTGSYLRKRLAATGTWQPIQVTDDPTGDEGIDLLIRDDEPYWIVADGLGCDCAFRSVSSNGLPIVELEDDIDNSHSPTLAVGPGGSFIAVWSATLNGDPFRLYMSTYNPDLVPIKHYYAGGRRIATRVGDALYYLLADHLGSTTVVADAEGNEVGHVVYDPFGEIVERTLPPGVTDRLFTGQRYDSYMELYDYGARWYDPGLGRFISPDTIIPEYANPQSLNRYSYVYNNPIRYTDPSGHCVFGLDTIVCTAVAVGLVVSGVALLSSASAPLPPEEAPPPELNWLGYGLLFGGAAVAIAPELAATGAAAACADDGCSQEANQISKFVASDAEAVARFAEEAPVVQAQRRFDSFGQVWNNVASDPNAVNDLFIHRAGERVTGMMEVVSRQNSNALEVKLLEGWGGAGTKLMQTAVQESINRGFDGRLILHAKDQAMKFYQDLGGKLIDPARNLFSFDEKAAQEILKLNP